MQAEVKAWVIFMDTPVAHLEEFGVPIRIINTIETRYGLYLKDLQTAQPTDLEFLGGMGKIRAAKVIEAIQLYWKGIVDGEVSGSRVCKSKRDVSEVSRRKSEVRRKDGAAYGRAPIKVRV